MSQNSKPAEALMHGRCPGCKEDIRLYYSCKNVEINPEIRCLRTDDEDIPGQ